MKNPLKKRFKHDLKSNKGRYFAIFMMLTVTIAIMSGFLAVSDGAQVVLNENRADCKLEDGSFTTVKKISSAAQVETEKLGAAVYENYYMNEKLPDETTLRIYKDREDINLVTVIKGKIPVAKDEIAVDRLFAENYGLEIGELLIINEVPMTISGVISVPDYSSLFKNNSDLMMDSFHFGIGVVTAEAFQSFPENKVITNYSYYFDNQDLSEKQTRNLATDIKDKLVENGVMLTSFITAENNQSVSFIDDDMGSDVPMMKVFLSLIILIMAFVFSIVITTSIEAEAPIIGTLLASGYTKYELIRHYMTMAIIVTLVSAFIGNIIGYLVMPDFFKGMYYGSYSLPPMEIKLNIEALLLTTVLPIGMMIGINFVALNRKLSISPLNFLRKELKKNKNRRAVKLPQISFFNRFRLRVMIQNKGSYLTLFVGIFLASFILMFGLVMTPMINHYVESIKKSAIADYQYILKTPVEPENVGNAEKLTCASLETYYTPTGKNIEVSFWGLQEDSDYFNVSISDDDEGAYISDGLAKKLGVESGDTMDFVNPYTDKEFTVKVIDITDYPGALTVFMSRKQLNNLLDRDTSYFNGYFSDEELFFADKNSLATVITPEDMSKVGDQMLSSFKQMAPLCLFAAIVIYLVLMYLLTKLVIDKNSLYISYLKVFGYKTPEIRKLYLKATTIVVLGSLILCLPLINLGIQGSFFLVQMKLSGYLPVYIPMYLYAEIVVIGMGSYFVINFIHVKRINHIELAAALKNRE